MFTRRSPSPYPVVTLAIFAVLALLLLFTAGCGPTEGPYLHTGLDSADTGEIGEAYADVAFLPTCETPWILLPPTSDVENRDRDVWAMSELYTLVYGDPDAARGLPRVYGISYNPDAGVWARVSYGVNVDGEALSVNYVPADNLPSDAQPFALACPSAY
jgi:hypothetical protein